MEDRKYPLARPPGHKPPVPRWKLDFPDPTPIHTAYIGVQRHESAPNTVTAFESAKEAVENWLNSDLIQRTENFTFLEGDDAPQSLVWVCYWSDQGLHDKAIECLNLPSIYKKLGSSGIGLWMERFTTSPSRLETNYSGLDYLPGLARLPGSRTVEHNLTAYWGAARDRIPDSGNDQFQRGENTAFPSMARESLGKRYLGTNKADNIVHIRSGQFWGNCSAAEAEAYETHLEPTLRAGLQYVWENRDESGAMGLRFLRNLDPIKTTDAKETCAAGFFRNLEDLERWSKRHPSHLAIFNGAMRHAKQFGQDRKFRTWHEVSILKRGEIHFEYLNCRPNTGVIRFLGLDEEHL